MEAGKKKENVVDEITTKQAKGGGAAAGTIRAFVVQTDEEVQCARMAVSLTPFLCVPSYVALEADESFRCLPSGPSSSVETGLSRP